MFLWRLPKVGQTPYWVEVLLLPVVVVVVVVVIIMIVVDTTY